MKVTPLSRALGAEITDIDLRQPQDATTVAAIRKTFDDNIFVVFRGQSCRRRTSCAPPAISARCMCGESPPPD